MAQHNPNLLERVLNSLTTTFLNQKKIQKMNNIEFIQLLKILIQNEKQFTPYMASKATELMMLGQASQAQMGAFLVAFKMSQLELNPEYIAAMAACLLKRSIPVCIDRQEPLLDIVGTGGDGQSTFNVSTASGIVVAGTGLRVVKVLDTFYIKQN